MRFSYGDIWLCLYCFKPHFQFTFNIKLLKTNNESTLKNKQWIHVKTTSNITSITERSSPNVICLNFSNTSLLRELVRMPAFWLFTWSIDMNGRLLWPSLWNKYVEVFSWLQFPWVKRTNFMIKSRALSCNGFQARFCTMYE